jgi:site-specific recombinase XerD
MYIPTVTPVINWRNEERKKGVYPIHLRVYIYGEPRRYYPIKVPLKVSLEQWTGREAAWVSNTHPYAFEINNRICEMRSKIVELTKRFYNQGKPVTFYAIERELLRKGDRSLLNDYFRNYIDHPPENVQLDPVTWEKYEAFLMHLNHFNTKIRFSDIDDTMIARIKKYLSEQKGRKGKLEASTIKSYFDKFKVVLTHAAKKDHLLDVQAIEQALEEITITIPKKKEGQHLEIEEIQALRKLEFTRKDQSLERDRDLFLFQVYTGFYYNDLQILKKTQLFRDIEYGYYIIGERDKNGNPTIIPLYKFPYASEILEKYTDKNPANQLLFRKEIFIEVQAYNRNLKLLAKRAQIIRPVSNKTGRHTNAQMWIRFGADRPVLSKMMGHQKEATTENYYKVNLREVIDGTKTANFEQFGI